MDLNQFIKDNRKSFPKYFKAKEIKKYHKKGQLYTIDFIGTMVGFYVMEEEKMKNLYIIKSLRSNSNMLLEQVFKDIKSMVDYCTIAVNERSSKVRKLALRNDFVPTDTWVQGKYHKLRLYAWS